MIICSLRDHLCTLLILITDPQPGQEEVHFEASGSGERIRGRDREEESHLPCLQQAEREGQDVRGLAGAGAGGRKTGPAGADEQEHDPQVAASHPLQLRLSSQQDDLHSKGRESQQH